MSKKLPTAKKTRKKFYNQYVYKVSLSIPGTAILRSHDLQSVKAMCLSRSSAPTVASWQQSMVTEVIANSQAWLRLISLLANYENSYSRRLESDTVDFYTNDGDLYQKLCEQFQDWVRLRFQPKKGTEQELLGSDKSIFVNQLPHGRYQYRAYLKPHRLEQKSRAGVAAWLSKQSPRITFTHSIEAWLLSNNENWDRRYIHVEDEATLLMIQLRAPQLIGRVFKYELNR